jgi:transposase
MKTAATHETDSRQPQVLHMSIELGRRKWRRGFSTGLGQKARQRAVEGDDVQAVLAEIAAAKRRFGLPEEARVVSGYEAGPQGFWVHRFLLAQGVESIVVDSASIEVNRRKRRAKSDGLDVQGLLNLLIRHTMGERKVWSVGRVPDAQAEDARHLHRELATLTEEQTAIRNRMRALLVTQGLTVKRWSKLREELASMRLWDGTEPGAALRRRIERDLERLALMGRQIKEIRAAMEAELQEAATGDRPVEMMQRLVQLRSIGTQGARVMVRELFGWREFRNRRQVGGATGLTPTPYQSGDSCHEQGISKAGNVWLRRGAIQITWNWLRWQPRSELTLWFEQRFASGGRRQRRVGIVAVARKLMIALWRYAEGGEVPKGAIIGEMEKYLLSAA